MGWHHSKRQQQTAATSLSNPTPKSWKTSTRDAPIASLHLKPPVRYCSHSRIIGTVHYIYNYGVIIPFIHQNMLCFYASESWFPDRQSCRSHRVPGRRRRRGEDGREETHTQPPRLLGTKFIPISNREFISGERYENQFPSGISVISVLPSSQSGIIPRNNHTPGLEWDSLESE